jgi:DNA-binding GntR family transcriptional regulator
MPIPNRVSPIPHRSINREVCARLREWIIEGALQPGEVIRDQSLAEQLGVSRTPVREALLCLEAEGLVETARNRWTKVTPISVETAQEIYPMIQTLEELALRVQAKSLGPELASGLGRANRKLAEAICREAGSAAVDADAEFHRLIVAGTGNSELIAVTGALAQKLRRIELAYFARSSAALASVGEHDEVIAAVENRNLKKAVIALSGNWRNSLSRLEHMATERSKAVQVQAS